MGRIFVDRSEPGFRAAHSVDTAAGVLAASAADILLVLPSVPDKVARQSCRPPMPYGPTYQQSPRLSPRAVA